MIIIMEVQPTLFHVNYSLLRNCLTDSRVDTCLGNGDMTTETFHSMLPEFVIMEILLFEFHLHFTAEKLIPVSAFKLKVNVLKIITLTLVLLTGLRLSNSGS